MRNSQKQLPSQTTKGKTMRHYYAAQSPRGFSNEIRVYVFTSRIRRDAWVDEHADDGDVNSAARGAYAITYREMRQITGYRGDDATASYNSAEPEFVV